MWVTLGLSVDVVTIGGAWIIALALVALVLTGWRQPARAQPRMRRGDPPDSRAVEVVHRPAEPYRRAGPVRRLLAALAGAGLTIVTGAVIAIVLSFAVAFTVVRVTSLLAQ